MMTRGRDRDAFVARGYLVALGAGVVVAFAPLLKYFLLQDDFVLLEQGAFHPFEAFAGYFAPDEGQFRPLSRGAYFAVAYRLFGLHALPYHVVSLAVHVANVVLAYALLRRIGVGLYGALTAATLFAVSSAHFTVIGWASCIQQLMAMFLVLTTLRFGVDAIVGRGRRALAVSVAAYALALLCLEQIAFAPVILAVIAALGLGGPAQPGAFRRAAVALRWHWLLLAAYLAFIVFWKTLPEAGVYRPSVGAHVWLNAWNYLARTVHFFVELPTLENIPTPGLHKANVFLALLCVYHLARARWRAVVFGLAFFVATSLPVVGLVLHVFYYQTYVVGFGSLFLIALAADDVYALLRRYGALRLVMLAAALVTSTAVSRNTVETNEAARYGSTQYARSFVVRRAKIARAAYNDVARQKSAGADRVVMVYGRVERAAEAKWNVANVTSALGEGSALRLFYENPDLDVKYILAADSVRVAELLGADVFVYGDFGHCRLAKAAGGGGD